MTFSTQELQERHITCKHPGANAGITHFVDGKPYCLEQLDGKDQYCSQPAGYATAHLNTGACKYHWGSLPERVQGYGKFLKRQLKERYNEFEQLDDIQMMEMKPELLLLRTLLSDSLDNYQETKSPRAMELTLRILDNVSTTIDRIDRIQSRQVLTAAIAKMMLLRAINVSKQFIDPDKMPAFLDLWKIEVQSLLMGDKQQQTINLPKQLEQFVDRSDE